MAATTPMLEAVLRFQHHQITTPYAPFPGTAPTSVAAKPAAAPAPVETKPAAEPAPHETHSLPGEIRKFIESHLPGGHGHG